MIFVEVTAWIVGGLIVLAGIGSLLGRRLERMSREQTRPVNDRKD